MPRYDYKCSECGQTTELKHGFNEKPPCPNCGGYLIRIIAPPTVIFRGDGFTRKTSPNLDYSDMEE